MRRLPIIKIPAADMEVYKSIQYEYLSKNLRMICMCAISVILCAIVSLFVA
jgi:hypothetical protein